MSGVVVVGIGAVASVGLFPEAIAAAVAGGISRMRTVETMRHARTGGPTKLALTSKLPVHAPIRERLQWLGGVASQQAVAPVAALRPRTAVIVSLPGESAGVSDAALTRCAGELIESLPIEPIREACFASGTGADGGVQALISARELLLEQQADVCLVGGIESFCDTDALEPLGNAGRLKDDQTPAGIIPGEGAAFLLLMRTETAQSWRLPALARLVGASVRSEPNPWYAGRSSQARGLSRAIADVFETEPPSTVAHVTYCDANGEHWRAEEWSFAYLRSAERHADPLELRHPADCWGDVGAASVPLLVATAIVDYRRGRSRGPGVLVWCASDRGPMRGAVLLEGLNGG